MTPNVLLTTMAAVLLLVVCVVSWHLVQTLRQARRTAFAMEQFLTSTRPRVESATARLDSIMGRADRIMSAAEQGFDAAAGAADVVRQAFSGWSRGSKLVTTLSATISAIVETWSLLTQPDVARGPEEAKGGETNE